MEVKSIVKFREPLNEEEANSLMIVLEVRDDRVLVSDLRFSEWTAPPTDVYLVKDLIVVEEFKDKSVKI